MKGSSGVTQKEKPRRCHEKVRGTRFGSKTWSQIWAKLR